MFAFFQFIIIYHNYNTGFVFDFNRFVFDFNRFVYQKISSIKIYPNVAQKPATLAKKHSINFQTQRWQKSTE